VPLLNLPRELLEAVRQEHLEYTKAKVIARIADPDQRQQVLEQVIADGLTLSQFGN
jgi:ParB family chromosome partitioning protein